MPWRESERQRRRGLTVRQFGIMIVALAAAGIVLTVLGVKITRELSVLTATPNDNQQWSMAQFEVEALVLLDAIKSNETNLRSSLDEVRERFDIFYSRIDASRALHAKPGPTALTPSFESLRQVKAKLDEMTQWIDAPDGTLREHLADLRIDMEEIRATSRKVALEYVQYFAQKSDAERKNLSTLIKQTSVFAVLLYLILSLTLVVLVRLFYLSSERAKALAESNDRFQKTIFAALDAILVVDEDGRVLDVNPAAEGMFGYSRNAFIGGDLADLVIPPRFREQHINGFRQFIATRKRTSSEQDRRMITAQRSNGEEFPVELALGSSSHRAHNIVIGFIRDVSERLRIEKELIAARDEAVEAAHARSRLLGFMSHEMRTPLNGVLAILDLLRRTPLNERQAGYIETALRSGEILTHLIADALDVTGLQANLLTLREAPFDLSALIKEVASINRPMAEAHGDSVDLDLRLPSLSVVGDRNRMRQVLMNLVGNAVKNTHDGSIRLEASAEPRDDTSLDVEIAVVDTGVGIPADKLELIFNEFVTLDSSDSRIPRGTGLGLSIAQRLVGLMGGSLTATSEVGVGSRFIVKLPLKTAPEEIAVAGVAPEDRAPPRAGLRVLLVEDNPTNRLVTGEMLTILGAEVDEAEDGVKGVEKASAIHYDMILMDLSMPNLDGVSATKAIRANEEAASRTTPIIGLTAQAMPGVVEELLAVGMQGCVYKPLRMAELSALLVDLFGTDDGGQDFPSERRDADDEPPPLDAGLLAELSEMLGADRFLPKLKAFSEEIGHALPTLAPPSDRDGRKELAAKAHRLAGSASVFGAARLRMALLDLETACQAEDTTKIEVSLSAVQTIGAATLADIADMLPDPE